jgi:hypothetical protein
MKKENGKKVVEAIWGTTAAIKKLLNDKVSRGKVLELLVPELINKGC